MGNMRGGTTIGGRPALYQGGPITATTGVFTGATTFGGAATFSGTVTVAGITTLAGILNVVGSLGIKSTTAISFLNGGSAQRIYTGGILSSNAYSDASLIPTNGIYSKGEIKTADQLTGASILVTGTVKGAYYHMDRQTNTDTRIQWYNDAYKAWIDYMSNPAIAVNGITPSTGTLVTQWARRSFIENTAGFGWIFESGSNSSTTPATKFEISSVDGSFKGFGNGLVVGTMTAASFNGSGASLTGIPNSATTATSANTANTIVARDGNAKVLINIGFPDTRAVATTPASYAANLIVGFKTNTVIGLPSGEGTYSSLIGFRGWSDDSGGRAHELAFGSGAGGGMYHRHGLTTGGWDSWSKVLNSTNVIKNEVPTGTKDSTNRVFTLAIYPATGSLELWLSGLLLTAGSHYNLSGSTITYVEGFQPDADEDHVANYHT